MMGGYTFDTPQSPIIPSADVHMFDGEIFTQVSSMVEARAAAGCALTSEGNIVVAGGFEEGPGMGIPLDSVEIYNPATDTWTKGIL